jgi:hypothetical protein
MDLAEFVATLEADAPPPALTLPLRALWWDAKGRWDTAHDLVQDEPGAEAALVHAHLHRKEGDLPNAAYWYRRSGRPVAAGALAAEWEAIARLLLAGLPPGAA